MVTTQFFGMKIQRYLDQYDLDPRLLAELSAKALRNGALNPNAWRRHALSVDEIADAEMVNDPLTKYMDVVAVYEVAAEAVGRARRGEGPSFIEAKTYRFYNHHGIQNLGLKYRSDEEVADWKARDPITILEQQMIDSGSATAADFEEVWSELRADIEAAIEFADASPVPEADQLMADVYTVSDHAAVAS